MSTVACTTPPVRAGGDVQLSPPATNIVKVNGTNPFSKQRSTYANGILESVCVVVGGWVGAFVSMYNIICCAHMHVSISVHVYNGV